MLIYDDWQHYLQYLDEPLGEIPDLNDPNLSDEKIKLCKKIMDDKIKNDEKKRIEDAAKYIGVSVEEYYNIMNLNEKT